MKSYRMAAAMGRGALAVLFFSCAQVAGVHAGTFCEDLRVPVSKLSPVPSGIVCRQVRTTTGAGLAFASADPAYSYADLDPEFALQHISFLLDMSQLNLGDKLHPNVELRIFELGFGLNQPVMPDNGIGGEPPVPNDGRAITLTVVGDESSRMLRFDQVATDFGFSPSMNWGITPPDGNSQTVLIPQGISKVRVDLDAFSWGNTDWSGTQGSVKLLVPGQGWSTPRPLGFNLAWGEEVRAQPIYVLSGVVTGDISTDTTTTTIFDYEDPIVSALLQ